MTDERHPDTEAREREARVDQLVEHLDLLGADEEVPQPLLTEALRVLRRLRTDGQRAAFDRLHKAVFRD